MSKSEPATGTAQRKSSHGRVRTLPNWGYDGSDLIGVTLSGSEHILTVDEALGLANAIIQNAADHQDRHMEDVING